MLPLLLTAGIVALALSSRSAPEDSEPRAPMDSQGRLAATPGRIPLSGWWRVLKRTYSELSSDNVGMLAAAVAYYLFLALFPGLVALVSITGLFLDTRGLDDQIASVGGLLPPEARGILADQLKALSANSSAALSAGALFGILLALWSTSKATKALITALNTAYDEEERRGFFKLNAVALLLTLGAILGFALAMAGIVGVPVVIELIGLPGKSDWIVAAIRWPILAVLVTLGFGVLYRLGPSRAHPRWQWISWGAAVAAILWLAGSGLFSLYVANFGNFDKTYGSLGAVVILLLWFNLSVYLIVLGAELNAELEKQTMRDSTTGRPLPLGVRRATAADTVAA